MLDRLASIFTSIRLTVVCLILALVLVFVGTIAQVDEGLYAAQNRFFRSFFVYWRPEGASWRIPFLPGGYLIGALLVLNLIAAHIKRFSLSSKKIGIFLTHFGLILLLVGGLTTDLLQVESHMRLTEGQSKNFSDSGMLSELAVVDKSKPDTDEVVVIPQSLIAKRGDIRHPKLPFTIRVQDYSANSWPVPRGPNVKTQTPPTSQGTGQQFEFQRREYSRKLSDQNIPAATVELITDKRSLGTWALSNWAVDEPLLLFLLRDGGWQERWVKNLSTPQQVIVEGKPYEISLRPVRYYEPYSIQLLEFRHDKYRGTEIPKNFSSLVRVKNPQTGENREVKIYMNNPLRYAGKTYYQASFDKIDPKVTVLQVVRNPSWLVPYISCILVSLGLIFQFMMHLISFAKKRSMPKGPGAKAVGSPKKASKSRSAAELAAANSLQAQPLRKPA
jgi:hypothetical protein